MTTSDDSRAPSAESCGVERSTQADIAGDFETVSSDADLLILVDDDDRETGSLDKTACHDGNGVLHRAFSLFVLNVAGETLLQRRGTSKRLWPGYWSNGCCSHPRHGEVTLEAVQRRAKEELGLAVDPRFIFKFQYHARFGDRGSEHELCSVFVSQGAENTLCVNPTEISEWRWISPADLDREIKNSPESFTPWLKLEWRRLQEGGEIRVEEPCSCSDRQK